MGDLGPCGIASDRAWFPKFGFAMARAITHDSTGTEAQ
jgi:hypothetical protein